MLTIHKFPIEPMVCRIEVPGGIRPLHVAAQSAEAMLWVLVDTELDKALSLQLLTVGTGHQIPPELRSERLHHLSTWMLESLVFHTFVVA